MSDRPETSIIIVNYNGGERLRECVASVVATASDAEVIVVDNASTDDSLAGVKDFRDLRVIRNSRNVGYAAAINAAAEAAHAVEFLVMMNMDVTTDPGWLTPLLEFLRQNPNAGAVNPLLILPDGVRINAIGQDVHVTALGFNRGLGTAVAAAPSAPLRVSGIQGAVFAMRRRDFEELGGIDASGFLYHEDVDLSWLLRMRGFELYCVPASRARHHYFLSMYPEKFHLLERNRVAMLLAHLQPATLLAISPMLLLTEVMAWGYSIIRGWRFIAAKARSYWWVVVRMGVIRRRRKQARALRSVTDWSVLKALRWRYSLDQFATLARERGPSARRQHFDEP